MLEDKLLKLLIGEFGFAAMAKSLLGHASPDERAHLAEMVAEKRSDSVEAPFRMHPDGVHILDPVSGLYFYPMVRQYNEFISSKPKPGRNPKIPKRDPLGFLLQEYAAYISAGMLYSGHINHSNPSLYNALKYFVKGSEESSSLTDLFRKNNILTPEDFIHPLPEHAEKISRLEKINGLLMGKNVMRGIMHLSTVKARQKAAL